MSVKIEVVKAHSRYWYYQYIGKTFEVKWFNENNYIVIGKDAHIRHDPSMLPVIGIKDCRIIHSSHLKKLIKIRKIRCL